MTPVSLAHPSGFIAVEWSIAEVADYRLNPPFFLDGRIEPGK